MKVRVIAPFHVPGLDADGRLEIPCQSTVTYILKRSRNGGPFRNLLPVSVNGVQVSKSYKLKEGDVIIFISPLSGG